MSIAGRMSTIAAQLSVALLRKQLARLKSKLNAEIAELRPQTHSRFTGDERIPADDDAIEAVRLLETCVETLTRAEESLT